jgi:signal transduction histidine kinase
VVLNLLVNAAHAISDVVKDSGAMGKLTVRTRLKGNEVEIAIGDSGTGIPPAVRERIFDPFFTTKEGRKMEPGRALHLPTASSSRTSGHTEFRDRSPARGRRFLIRIPVVESSADRGVERVAA